MVGYINNGQVVGLVGPTDEVTTYVLAVHEGFFMVDSTGAGTKRCRTGSRVTVSSTTAT
jgi:hypothetical protein